MKCSEEYEKGSTLHTFFKRIEDLGNSPDYAAERELLKQQKSEGYYGSLSGKPLFQYGVKDQAMDKAMRLNNTYQCPEGEKYIARHSVPANLSVKDKIYIVEMRKQGRRNLDEHERRPSLGYAPSQRDKANTPNCKNIAEQIKHLDNQMRQPQSASSMSYLTDQRRKMSDRRFRECR